MVYESPKTFKEIAEQFVELGKMVGKANVAQQIIAESEERIKEIQKKEQANHTKYIFPNRKQSAFHGYTQHIYGRLYTTNGR